MLEAKLKILLSKPHMGGAEQNYIAEAFSSNFIAPTGPQLEAFEYAVSQYLGGDVHCVALASGTAALHLALKIAGVSCGDEVWVTSMTFAGGIFPITYLGANPRLFDVSPETWMLDLNLLESALIDADRKRKLPAALVPTDLYGQCLDLASVEQLATRFGVKLIIDAAESLGATSFGKRAGSGGDASILSFNGNKIITTSGGGMLVTKHKKWADKARFLSTQARDDAPHYQHSEVGFNYRLSNICAAIGLGQLEVLSERVAARRKVFDRYFGRLSPLGFDFMPEVMGTHGTRWLSTMTCDPDRIGVSREDIRLRLLHCGIESRPLWKPMHLQPLYANCQYQGSGIDEQLFANGLCLPSGSDLSVEEQDDVMDIISKMVG